MKKYMSFLFFIVLLTWIITWTAMEMQARVIHVATTQDKVAGSLRAAITTANNNSENDTIYLPAGTYLLTGAAGEDANAGGDLDLKSIHKINITGAGRAVTIIDGNNVDRVLHILKGKVIITGVTIRGGKTVASDFFNWTESGGGIRNHGDLELSHCTISDNTTGNGAPCRQGVDGDTGGFSGVGGGIANFNSLILTRCIITNNSTGKGGGGSTNQTGGSTGWGGGIYNSENSTITLTGCTVSFNKIGDGGSACGGGNGGNGGGICNSEDAEINFYQCTIDDNRAGNGGNASCAGESFPGGNGGSGGGIYNIGRVTLRNCTVSYNRTGAGGNSGGYFPGSCGDGGGISTNWDDNLVFFGTTNLINCTITGNFTGGYAQSGRGGNGGGLYVLGGDLDVSSSIVANNAVSPSHGAGHDVWGNLDSGGFNIINLIHSLDGYEKQPGDISGVDPLLGPLAENGGPTKTHALLRGSPAIDAGYSFGITIDQRGFTRPVDIPGIPNVADGSDIGAYEAFNTYSISGTINYGNGGSGLDGVTLTFSNNGGTAVTASNGSYSQPVPQGWSGTVTPSKAGYKFNPPSRSYSSLQSDQTNQNYGAEPLILPAISVNRNHLNFGFVNDGNQSGTQTFSITNSGGGILDWEVDDDADWLNCSPSSGRNHGTITATVETAGLAIGTYTGMITINAAGTSNSPQKVNVTLVIYAGNTTGVPFGYFETPTDGATVYGSIPVTGWALDDIGVESVKIYRALNEHFVFIGNAVFVEGARPDVELAYPGYPNNYKAGWGYMLLTNVLPNDGNGTFTLHALAFDKEGHQVHLGWKTITVDNAHAVKPFGAIDTPTQGGQAGGTAYRNSGWVLTPQPNKIPEDGHTISVWVDGKKVGSPLYNFYREDVATLFPGYANSNGAHAYLNFDTTAYGNGMHTIMWTAEDSGGNAEGIGSRYFDIQNGTGDSAPGAQGVADNPGIPLSQVAGDYPGAIQVQKGFRENGFQTLYPDSSGQVAIEIKELMRLEIDLTAGKRDEAKWWGFLKVGDSLRKLPAGSSLDSDQGIFYWTPGPGFIDTYDLVFIKRHKTGVLKKRELTIKIIPKF